MATTAEHCIAAIGLNAYRPERNCHDLVILSLLAHLHASQLGGSCLCQPIAVLQLTVEGVLRMIIAPTAINHSTPV